MRTAFWLIIFIINLITSHETKQSLEKIIEKDDISAFEKIYPSLEISSPIDFIDSSTDLKADKISKYIITNVSYKQVSRADSGLMMNKLLLKTLKDNLHLSHNEILRRNLYHLRTKDEMGRNIIHDLAKSGELFLLDEIVKSNKPKKIRQILNSKDLRGFKPFMLTAYNARKDLAEFLYQNGTKLNQNELNEALKIQLSHNRAEYDYIDYLFEIGLRPREDLTCLLDSMFGPGAFGNRYNDSGLCSKNCLLM